MIGCEHIKIYADTETIKRNLIDSIYQCETPLTRLAAIPLGMLSEEVRRRNIKFVLCGEGVDELYAGYPVFERGQSSIEAKWNKNITLFNYITSPSVADRIRDAYKVLSDHDDTFAAVSWLEIETKLSGYLLSSQGDRTSMKNGVEQRFPFLDLESYRYSLHAPINKLIRNGRGKYILRELYKHRLPHEITERIKQGYMTPDFELIQSIVNDKRWREIVSSNINRFPIFNANKTLALLNNVNSPDDAQIILFILTVILLDLLFIQKNRSLLNSYEQQN